MDNYFTLFSIPAAFNLDLPALEQSYFNLQRQYHPDRFATKSAEERANAMQMSVRVNDAYHTLKLPLLRAQYLLQLQSMPEARPEQAVLVENMEMQEQLVEADSMAAIAALAARAEAAQDACLGELRMAFSAKDLTKAAQAALRLSYLTKLNEHIRQKKFKISSPWTGEDQGGGQPSRRNGPPSQPSPLQGEGE